MAERPPVSSRPLMTIAAFVVVVAGMKAAQPILIPFLLSLFIAILSAPALLALRRRGLPTWLSLLLVVLVVGFLGSLVVGLVGSSVRGFTANLPKYEQALSANLEPLQGRVQTTVDWLAEKSLLPQEMSRDELLNSLNVKQAGQTALRMAAGTFTGLAGVLTNTFLIFITVVFVLLEASSFRTKLEAIFQGRGESLAHLDQIATNVNRYMAIKTAFSLATGLGITVFLTILGVDFPLLWGLFAFLLNFIPNIGSILAAIPPALLALVQFGPARAGGVALGFLAVNVLVGSILEPRFMGKGLGLSTLVVFLSLVFWGWVLGPVGMLLSVPLTMTLKIALGSNEGTRWIAILLGSEGAAKAELTDGG